ncbi:MAG: cytochrome D1 domain-containing protein [Acidimicrobiia bacterium]|jgi:mono/diheme cytochrome c family protein/DNA-binding beta-propeller fold protein YncE
MNEPAKRNLSAYAIGGLIGVVFALVVWSLAGWGTAVAEGDDVESTATTAPGTEVDVTTGETFEGTVQGKAAGLYFLDSCAGCHGTDRRGATGPALLPERLSQDDAYYSDVIANGKPGTVMPPWGGQLTDEDIATLVEYIRSDTGQGPPQWTFEDIEASHEILVADSDLPDSPTHDSRVDNLMLVTEREAQGIAVIDGDTHELIGKIDASYRAHGYTFSPVEDRWAYNMGRDGWVFKIDLYTLRPVAKVRIGLDSRALAISDDGKYLIAGNYVPTTAIILDADTLEPLKVFDATATNPEGEMVGSRVATILDTSPDLVGPYFLVALKEAGQVWRIDWSQPDFPVTSVTNVGHILHDGFLSPDNHQFYLAAQTDDWMAVIDVETMAVVDRIKTGATPHPGSGATWESDGVEYGATVHAGEGKVTIWDLATNEIVGTVETAGAGLFIRASEHSPYVWADAVFAEEPHAITVFEKAPPFEKVGVIEDGVRTLHPEFTDDGAFVYISDWDANEVRVYDATTLDLVAEVPDIVTPTGIFNVGRRVETLGH